MIAIYLDNGHLVMSNFIGFDGDSPASYTLKSAEHLTSLFGRMKVLQDSDGWYYSVDKIVKFKSVTEEEFKSLKRDDTLGELLNDAVTFK